jgi:short chain dehydrogenase
LPATTRRALVEPARVRFVSSSFEREFRSERGTSRSRMPVGVSSGIGLAAARQFIKEGAKVIVTGRSPRSVGNAQKELGANVVAIAADVTKSAELNSLFPSLPWRYGAARKRQPS